MTQLRHAAIAAALIASATAAQAQTTIITREPVQTQTVVTERPLALTPVQRQTIYRTITRERVTTAPPPSVDYRVGTRVPGGVELYAVPDTVAVDVPAVRQYKYISVNDRVLLIDPATSEVVAELAE